MQNKARTLGYVKWRGEAIIQIIQAKLTVYSNQIIWISTQPTLSTRTAALIISFGMIKWVIPYV